MVRDILSIFVYTKRERNPTTLKPLEIMTTTLTTLTAKTQKGLTFDVTVTPSKTISILACKGSIVVKAETLECTIEFSSRNGSTVKVKTAEFFKALGMKSPTKDETMLIKLTSNVEALLKEINYEFSANLDAYHATQKEMLNIAKENAKAVFIAGGKGAEYFVNANATVKRIAGEIFLSADVLQEMGNYNSKKGETFIADGGIEKLKNAAYYIYNVDTKNGTVTLI